MCMITYIPANIAIPEEGIENGAIFNDDGHGWAIASKYGMLVFKSMDYDESMREFLKMRKLVGEDSLAMFHSRLATHGTTDTFNVHPFYVTPTTVMAHNGILPKQWHPKLSDPRSDTQFMADVTMPGYLTTRGIPSRRGGKELGRMIGTGNKLVILSVATGKPTVRIVNARSGIHDGGVWYSNDGFMPSRWTERYWGTGYLGTSATYASFGSAKEKAKEVAEEIEFGADGYFPLGVECEICFSKGTTNIETDICVACGICQTCTEEEKSCVCSWRVSAKEREEREAEEAEFLAALEKEVPINDAEREAAADAVREKRFSKAVVPWSAD